MALHAERCKRFADDRMLQLRRVRHALEFRIFDNQIRHECLVQRDVDVAVNRGSDEEAAEFFIIRRQIRAAAAEADAKG